MATYTVRNVSLCSGGGHVHLDIYRDGTKVAQRNFEREELLTRQISLDDVLFFLLREAVKSAGATTLQQAKAAVEAKEWVL